MLQNRHVLLTFDKVHNPLRLPLESASERPKVLSTRQFLHFWLQNVLRATTACTFSTSQLPKVVLSWCVLYILTSKCASRHNGVHFIDISTSKSGPELVCFVHFDFKMCFAPQRRALYRHLHFQKWSGAGVFCTFWLSNVLRATTTCNFSSLIWPDGSAPAALASLLFDPPEPQIIGIPRGRRSTKDMFIREVRRSGRWFPERGCILEHQIFRFAEMILRDRCSTPYDLASLFRGKRSSLDRWSGKIAKRIGTRPSALHSTFHFGRKSRRFVSFLMLSTSKIEEVSQNCFVFDVVKFKNCCNYIYKCHYTTLLLQLQVQIYYATLHNTNYTTLH